MTTSELRAALELIRPYEAVPAVFRVRGGHFGVETRDLPAHTQETLKKLGLSWSTDCELDGGDQLWIFPLEN